MRPLIFAAAAASFLSLPALADESCQLKQIAVIPFVTDDSGQVFVPATLNNQTTHLMLDTGAFWGGISDALAKKLGLKIRHEAYIQMQDLAGEKTDTMTTVSELKLGNLAYDGPVDFFVSNIAQEGDKHEGVLGRNLFTHMDLEIDNAQKTISLYSQEHCKGAGVYWADEEVALPFKRGEGEIPMDSHIRRKPSEHQIDTPKVSADLDGETVSVLFDTGATETAMDIDHATRRYGITTTSPGVKPAGKVFTATGAAVDSYSYTFKSLTISGITFENVPVVLGDFKSAQVILGMHELRHLHLYFAFKDGIIHVTGADAKKSAQ